MWRGGCGDGNGSTHLYIEGDVAVSTGVVDWPTPLPHPCAMTLQGFPRISVDPQVCGGRPIVTGTRVRVSDVLEMLAGGASAAEIVADFPYLAEDDVRAVLAYAAAQADHAVVLAA